MKISFTDAALHRVFCDIVSLRGRFGAELASKIASRMGVLKHAENLGMVPQRPPIQLRVIDQNLSAFSVDLVLPVRLFFAASVDAADKRPKSLEAIKAIEIHRVR